MFTQWLGLKYFKMRSLHVYTHAHMSFGRHRSLHVRLFKTCIINNEEILQISLIQHLQTQEKFWKAKLVFRISEIYNLKLS